MAGTKPKSAPTKTDQMRKDEYDGKYKSRSAEVSTTEQWGTNQNPVRETPTPFRNLKKVGG